MITINVSELAIIKETLQKLNQKRFSASVAYKIARLMNELEKETQLFEQHHTKLITAYADKDESGKVILENNQVHIPKDKIEEFNAQLSELINNIVEINAEKISIEELFGDEKILIEDIKNLMPIIKETGA